MHALSAVAAAALAGSALAQPAFTQAPLGSTFQVIGLYVSDDGLTCSGLLTGNTSFIWHVNGNPAITTIAANGSQGPSGSVAGMNTTGTRFVFGYRDSSAAANDAYPFGLITPALYREDAFWLIVPPSQAAACDASIVTPRAMSGDGQKIIGSAWNRCSVAPFAWTEAIGWTAWATQDTYPPFGQTGYVSHQVTATSRDGAVSSGWYASGTGYGGRTALVWTNNGATVSRLDDAPHSAMWGQADAVSGNGQYIAGSMVPGDLIPDGGNQQYANKYLYRWSAATGVEVLPGKIDTQPGSSRHPTVGGVSDDGRLIVGQDGSGLDREAFIWTPETGGMRLSDYLLTKGLDLANDYFVTLTSAAGLSSNGRYVTGQWTDFGGSSGAYILDLGERATQTCGPADMGSQGGVPGADLSLDNNDFIVFINKFFAGDSAADLGVQGGLPGHDGQFDNNDFIAFISLFFSGCGE